MLLLFVILCIFVCGVSQFGHCDMDDDRYLRFAVCYMIHNIEVKSVAHWQFNGAAYARSGTNECFRCHSDYGERWCSSLFYPMKLWFFSVRIYICVCLPFAICRIVEYFECSDAAELYRRKRFFVHSDFGAPTTARAPTKTIAPNPHTHTILRSSSILGH